MDWPALVIAISILLTSLGGLITQLWAIRAVRDKFEKVDKNVEQIHKATNSMKDELVAEVRKAATLQGAKDERARTTGETTPEERAP